MAHSPLRGNSHLNLNYVLSAFSQPEMYTQLFFFLCRSPCSLLNTIFFIIYFFLKFFSAREGSHAAKLRQRLELTSLSWTEQFLHPKQMFQCLMSFLLCFHQHWRSHSTSTDYNLYSSMDVTWSLKPQKAFVQELGFLVLPPNIA